MRGLIRLIIILSAILRSLFFWNIKKKEPHKILIAHDLLLGDTLLLAPLMKRIHEKYPNSKKYILAKPAFVPLYANTPYGFKVLSFNPKSFLSVWKIFCEGPYDLAFIAGDNRLSWLSRAVGSRWLIGIEGDTPPWKNWMLDEVKPFDSAPATWADMMGRLVDGINPAPYQKNEWLCPEVNKLDLLNDQIKPYILCHLGASSPLKFWPQRFWQALLLKIYAAGYDIFLSVGPGEERLIYEIDPEKKYKHIQGNYSLSQMWLLMKSAELLISPDTGITHLAKIAFVPNITLYGPGSHLIHGPGIFWNGVSCRSVTEDLYPCRDQEIFFRRKVRWIKRCGRTVKECRTPGACMQMITPEKVYNEVMFLLDKK